MQGQPRQTGHSGEFWKNVIHWREWQTTPVCLPWEPHELYKKAQGQGSLAGCSQSMGSQSQESDTTWWLNNGNKNTLVNTFAFILQLLSHTPGSSCLRSRPSTTTVHILNPGPRAVFKITTLKTHFWAEVTKARNVDLYAQFKKKNSLSFGFERNFLHI